jgi:N-acetylglucosamine kinase-like BadF-type ATPase
MIGVSAMSVAGHRRNRLVVGVDLGGTWVRVLALAESGRDSRVTARAPHARDAAPFLQRLWQQRGWRGRVASVVVAARGVWTARERATVRARLRGLGRRVHVISDAEAAWMGALEGGAGVLILAGTGSIVLARTARGRWARAGGLGPLFGDEGSAFWLGREWLRASGRDARTLRKLATSPDPVARIAAHAPAVVARARRGDRTALRVVRAAQDHLAGLAAGVAADLKLRPPVPVGGAGSVMRDPWFRAGVQRALARHGVRARWQAQTVEPVVAAARLAARLIGLTWGPRRASGPPVRGVRV